jgi:hypothetical protein
MRLLALTAASAALCVFATTQIPQVLAQGTNIQTGASANQGNAEQGRSSGGASTQSNSRGQSSSGSSERSTAGVRAEKSRPELGSAQKAARMPSARARQPGSARTPKAVRISIANTSALMALPDSIMSPGVTL